MTTRVVVLGANGMLGHVVAAVLGREPALEVVPLTREHFDVRYEDLGLEWRLVEADWVINCVGVTKPRINERSAASVAEAVRVNSWFPYHLVDMAWHTGTRVIQIGTDCVFRGASGRYNETDPHNADDIYGRTKSLGEPPDGPLTILRCSIIGPELGRSQFLWEWLKGQPLGAVVPGFAHHLWNGITTLAFARICRGLILTPGPLPRLKHVVPADVVDKATLLVHIAAALGRSDLQFVIKTDGPAVDRTLTTRNPEFNRALWQAAGYADVPSIQSLVQEMAQWSR